MSEKSDFQTDEDEWVPWRELKTPMARAKWLLDAEEWDGGWEQNLIEFVQSGGLEFIYQDARAYQKATYGV